MAQEDVKMKEDHEDHDEDHEDHEDEEYNVPPVDSISAQNTGGPEASSALFQPHSALLPSMARAGREPIPGTWKRSRKEGHPRGAEEPFPKPPGVLAPACRCCSATCARQSVASSRDKGVIIL